MRFHVLGLPHTISTPEYSSCAFTQKVVKLCAMLTMEGHKVFHYGHSQSKVACDENIAITNDIDLRKSYPKHNWRKQGWPAFSKEDPIYRKFYEDAPAEIVRRFQPGDFLLCSFGGFHKPVADKLPMLTAVESGIGYPNGTFAKFKIYESYAIMHAYQGNVAAMTSGNDFWYDAVIPNAINFDEFDYANQKGDYLLFLGRINAGKGIHIAIDLAEKTKTRLIVAGAGDPVRPSPYVKQVGIVGPKERRALLSGARAVICASTFLEPFCGVQIEAMASGTPVISSDWGAFAEYNKHHVTGFRCKTFEQFEWAVQHVDMIEPSDCRSHAKKFALEVVAPHYTDYFKSISDVRNGKGWYEPNPSRTTLRTASF